LAIFDVHQVRFYAVRASPSGRSQQFKEMRLSDLPNAISQPGFMRNPIDRTGIATQGQRNNRGQTTIFAVAVTSENDGLSPITLY